MPLPIDLRSDVLGGLTSAQVEAMVAADLGWAYLSEDPTVARLESLAAATLGKEAALLTPTCSMANLVALMTLGRRGSQVVLEAASHIAAAEAWGLAYITGLFAGTITAADGILPVADVEAAMARSEAHDLAGTSLLCLENTHTRAGGVPLSPPQTLALAAVARRHGASVHLDGARLFNAAVALRVPIAALASPVDTVAVSLNKGLGGPMGALLAGSAETISTARLNLKRLGGASIHQAGLLAAAGLVALTTGQDRLADDHRRAADLAGRLAAIDGLCIDEPPVRTNIVVIDTARTGLDALAFLARLRERDVLGYPLGGKIRLVTHRLVGDAEVEAVVDAFAAIAAAG